MDAKIIETKIIPISLIDINSGQIDGLRQNPRYIDDDEFEALKQSLESYTDMTNLRELIVYPHEGRYVVIGGNMRLHAMQSLGWSEAPCKVLDECTTIADMNRMIIADNASFGEWNNEDLASDWSDCDLESWGITYDAIERGQEEADADESGFATMTFTFSPEQFKHVKQALNAMDKDNGIAILKLLDYGI